MSTRTDDGERRGCSQIRGMQCVDAEGIEAGVRRGDTCSSLSASEGEEATRMPCHVTGWRIGGQAVWQTDVTM